MVALRAALSSSCCLSSASSIDTVGAPRGRLGANCLRRALRLAAIRPAIESLSVGGAVDGTDAPSSASAGTTPLATTPELPASSLPCSGYPIIEMGE